MKLDDHAIDLMTVAAREGVPLARLADLAGVQPVTLRRWRHAGEQEQARRERGQAPDPGRDLHVRLVVGLARARAEREQDAIRKVKAAADSGVWQAAAWFLERSNPEAWGQSRQELRQLTKRLRELERLLAAKGAES